MGYMGGDYYWDVLFGGVLDCFVYVGIYVVVVECLDYDFVCVQCYCSVQ